MGLNRFRGQISSRIKLLDNLIKKKEKALKYVPPGTLRICTSRNYLQYYQSDDKNNRTYISKDNWDLIRKLAQKDYDSEVLKLAIKEKELLEQLLKKYPKASMEEHYETLQPHRRELIKPVWVTNEEFIANWEATPYEQKKRPESEYHFITNRGEWVRSKSEKMIADRFFQMGTPYRYEAKLVLEDGTVIHPDFTLLNMQRRCEVYLEHFGRMDDPGYANKSTRRMRLYRRNKIVLGTDLYISMETSIVPIDMEAIDNIIDSLR